MVGAPGSLPSEPPADCHARGTRGRSCDLHPPSRRPSKWGFPLRRASPLYPGRMGVGKELSGARPRDLRPRVKSRGESFHPLSTQLGSQEIRGNYPRTPPSVRGEAAGLPGWFEDRARPERLQPSPPRGPRSHPPPSPGAATSGSPLGPASPRARTTPHGVLSLRSESLRCLLPAQNGGGGHRSFSSPSSRAEDPSASKPLPSQPDLFSAQCENQAGGGPSFENEGVQVSLVKRHLLKDLEQKKVATPNQTNCNTKSPAALEEAKTSRVPGSPRTSPEPHDPGGSLPLTPRMESHSEEEDPPGSGLGWNGRGPRARSPGGCSVEAVLVRKKHRRRPSKRKRHWRPYLELSWAEKQQRDERQGQRASRVREEMFAKGQPVAPYNTTQFLMNDRDPEEPDLDVPRGASHPGSSGESEAGDSDSRGRAHGEFQQRDFSEAYERYHTESLQGRSKQELVRDYLDLERRLSQAEEETRRLQGCASQRPCRQVEELAAEVERLRTENQRLRQENEMWNREAGRRGGEPGT
ncbi:LOW QUALITY PROTEIN: protein HEXIM2 [Mesoplodon densirostris]|uniref:LOW QUALITY PROTEIN: protein HEXIM2 n=1 Tax=Mesoplodon densirostris TaxID=48708 RepID=UPI0028DAFA43|nr:LOW QUALITY PROTEIN: protein HEXIM2 [Mesoplodon densirostris]